MENIIKKFYFLPKEQRKGITSSLLLDEPEVVLSGETRDYRVTVKVNGDTRLKWKGGIYKSSFHYPEDLVECIKSRHYDNPDLEIIDCNWYKLTVEKLTDSEHILESKVVDIDLSSMTDKDARHLIVETVKEITAPFIPINEDGEVERMDIKLSPTDTPKAFAAKVRELVKLGLDEKEAQNAVKNMVFEMELYYEEGYGLFAVESEAITTEEVRSPYSGIRLKFKS